MNKLNKICVYCASSQKVDDKFFESARQLGVELAENDATLVYGGGQLGLMGAIANTMLENNAKVIGIMPAFMDEVEWSHRGITELILVEDMNDRKRKLIEGVDAVVTLPGGCGTLEELSEVITLKRLGKFLKPIIIYNQDGFYDPLIEMLERMIDHNFLRPEHRDIWTVVDRVEDIIPAIRNTKEWTPDAIKFAAV